MSMIKSYTQADGLQVDTVFVNAVPWLCGKQVAEALGYFPADQAIRNHVRAKWKMKLYELVGRDDLAHNDQNKWYISEPGFWQLAATVRTERAELFQDWLFETVLPNLRKNGLEGAQLAGLKSECALHYRVVKFIRDQLPIALISPGLGDLQDTPRARGHAWRSGYAGGQPDLLILNSHKKYSGFAIEFKHPLGGGVLAENQRTRLDAYAQAGFKTMVSCDYDAIIVELVRYFADVRVCCKHCSKNPRKFKTAAGLIRHVVVIHKITGP